MHHRSPVTVEHPTVEHPTRPSSRTGSAARRTAAASVASRTVGSPPEDHSTTDGAEDLITCWRAMTPGERALLADRLSAGVATLAEAGIRLTNPSISPTGLRHELLRRRYGSELADAASSEPSGR